MATALVSAQTEAAEPNPFAPNAPSPVAPKPLSPGELKVFDAPTSSTPVLDAPLPQIAPTVEAPVQKAVEVSPTPIEPDTKAVSSVASDATPDADSDAESGWLDSLQNIFISDESEEVSEKPEAPQPKTSELSPPAKPMVENIEIPQMAPEVQTPAEKPVTPPPPPQSAAAPEIPQVTDIAVQQDSVTEAERAPQQTPITEPQIIKSAETPPKAETETAKQAGEENADQQLKLEAQAEPVVAPEISNPIQSEMPEIAVKEMTAQPVVPEEKELDQERPTDTTTTKRNIPPGNALVKESPSYLQLDQMRSPKTNQGFFDRLANMLTPDSTPKTSAAKVSIDIPNKKSAEPPETSAIQIAEKSQDKTAAIQATEEENSTPVELMEIDEDKQTVSSSLEPLTDEPAKAGDQPEIQAAQIVDEAVADKTSFKEAAPEIPEIARINPTPNLMTAEAPSPEPVQPNVTKAPDAAPTPEPMAATAPEPAATSQPIVSKVPQARQVAQIAEKIEPLEPVPEAAMPVEAPDIPTPPKMLADAAKTPAPVPEGITPIDPNASDAGDEIASSISEISQRPAFTTLNKTPETLIAETHQEEENTSLFGRLTRLFNNDPAKPQSNERHIVVEAKNPPSDNDTPDSVQVAAVQPEAQLPPPRDATFKTNAWGLGDNVQLTQLEPTQEGKHVPCFDKSFLARTHCVVDVNWPANLEKAFDGGGVLYNGTKAIVAYDQGRATRLYALFESNSYEAVVAHFQKMLGPPHFRSIRKIRVLQGPRLANDFVIWHMGKSSSNDGPVTVEIRRYDDVRQTFPDSNSGLVRVYFDHTIPLFKRVSPLDFLTLR